MDDAQRTLMTLLPMSLSMGQIPNRIDFLSRSPKSIPTAERARRRKKAKRAKKSKRRNR